MNRQAGSLTHIFRHTLIIFKRRFFLSRFHGRNGGAGEMATGRFRFLVAGFVLERFATKGLVFRPAVGPRFTAAPAIAPATVPAGPAITLPMMAPATIRTTRRRSRCCEGFFGEAEGFMVWDFIFLRYAL